MLTYCHCCTKFAIAIWNSNSAKDDNFKVLLNGMDIGHIDNNQSALTGRIFAEGGAIDPAYFGPQNPNVFEPTVTLDLSMLSQGTNTLRIESIQDNGNGNAGAVRVGYWKQGENAWPYWDMHGTPLLIGGYGFASGVGNGQDLTFNYP